MAFPASPLGIKVELLINATWTDISSFVYHRDNISISPFGRTDEASSMQPAQLTLTLNNRSGRFTPNNASGAYYPYVQLNTQIRVSVNDTSANATAYSGYRFWGEVSNWPAAWDESGKDIYASITASGIWRRLSQSTKTLGSPYTRYNNINVRNAWTLASYWPMEDGGNSNTTAPTFANLVTTQSAMTVTSGTPALASCTAFPGSDAIPQLNGAKLTGTISTALSPTNVLWRFNMFVQSGGDTGAPANALVARMTTSGTVARVEVSMGSPSGGGPITITGYSSGGTQLFTGSSALSVWGIPLMVQVSLAQSGGNINWGLRTMLPGAGVANTTVTGSIAGTVSDSTSVIFNPGSAFKGVSAGQSVVIYGNPVITDAADALNGWATETADARFLRVCGEEGIAATLIGTAGTGAAMGPQTDDTLANVLKMIEATDGGQLFETRTQFGLGYRTMASLQNQVSALSLDYAAAQVVPPLTPVNDEQLTRNDITLTNYDGYAVRAYLATGARSILAPPNGVGSGYEYTRNVSGTSHSQVNALATQILNSGTVKDDRYPTVTVDLSRAQAASLFSSVPSMGIGDYLTLTNMPAYGGAATQKLLAWGWTETLSNYTWTIAFNAIPEAPWETTFNPGTSVLGQVPGMPTTAGQAGAVSGGEIAAGGINLVNLSEQVLTYQFGGITSTITGAAPATPAVGDLWFDSSNGYQIKRWDGSSWVPVTFDGSNILGAGTITAGLIGADAVVAGTVAAGAIDGQVINGVVLNGVIVNATSGGVFVYQAGGGVLNLNPDFTAGITNWTAGSGAVSYTTPTLNSHNTMKLAISSSISGRFVGDVESEFENVTAGNNYLATFIVQLSAVDLGGATLQVDWYNSSGVFLSSSLVANPVGTVSAWTTYSGVVTAPVGAAKMKLRIQGSASANTAFVNVGQAKIAANPTLVASVAPQAGTDQYGHAYVQQVAAYDSGGGVASLAALGGQAQLSMKPTGQTKTTTNAYVYAYANNPGAANEYQTAIFTSGKSNGERDAGLALQSEPADASASEQAFFDFGGFVPFILTRSYLALDRSVPIEVFNESWNNMTLSNGWTVGSGGFAQYKLMPDNTVMIRLNNVVPGTITDGTVIWVPPSGYIPTVHQKLPVAATYSAAPVYGSMPFLYTNGPTGLEVFDLRGTVSGIHTTVRYALD